MKRTLLAIMIILAGTSGCAYSVHVNHTGDFQVDKALVEYRVVESRGEQFTVLGMVGQTDFVNHTFTGLQDQCPDGEITGIQTRYSTSLGFFSWTHVVQMRGYCSLP